MPRLLAQIRSFIGHPLLVPTYAWVLLLLLNPFAFGVRDLADPKSMLLLISVFASTFLIPGFGVALMKPLGLIKSLEMRDKQERIGPYIITGVFYLWLFKNLVSNNATPALFNTFVLGTTIGLFFAFFTNIFTKISAHATGMGGFVTMLVVTAFEWPGLMAGIPAFGGILQISTLGLIAAALVLAGLVGTARLALGAHTAPDLYRGYVAGVAAILIACAITGMN